jgi:hypothetical protein
MKAKCFAAIIMVCLMTSVAHSDRPDNAKPATLLPALVWNPHSLPSGDSLYQTLQRAGYRATLTLDLTPFLDSLTEYHLFIMAGIPQYGDSPLTYAEFYPVYDYVIAFLQEGGCAYWEGPEVLGEISQQDGRIWYYFPSMVVGIFARTDYLVGLDTTLFADIDSLEYDEGPHLPYVFEYIGGTEPALVATPATQGYPGGIIYQSGPTRTMLAGFSWARLNDSGLDTRVELAHCVMNWLSGAVAVEEPEPLPQAYSLTPPYPNPFNAQTTIEYASPNEAAVSLSVFDIQGRKVATLTEGTKPAGYHRLIWDAKGMPSGLYFVRLKAGEFEDTKKMTLLK